MAQSNPNGANQFLLDPRQKLCWEFYVDPKSATFGNATQSAIRAGYETDYAEQITGTEWFKVKVRRLNMLDKAEKVLDETLEMDDMVSLIIDGSPFKKIDPALKKIKQDTAKFLADRLGKDEGYSTKTETDITTGGESINSISTLSPEAQEAIRKIYEEETKKKILNP